jgi:ParB family chromosome partitioning protein
VWRHRDEGDESEDGESDGAGAPFTPEDKARAGALVTLTHDGDLRIERGLVHPDDAKAEAKGKGEGRPAIDRAGLSATMVEDLTAHRTAALRVELARSPATALAATVHALALSLLYNGGSESCLELRASSEALERYTQAVGDSPAHQAMAEEGERWGEQLPGDASDLFAWCLAQPQDKLLDLLAFLAALTVDAVQTKQGRGDRHAHADRLAETLSLDMRQWWTPSVEGFYQRLPKAALAELIAEAKVPLTGGTIGKITKAEAARIAAKALTGTGWLPEPLKVQSPALAA